MKEIYKYTIAVTAALFIQMPSGLTNGLAQKITESNTVILSAVGKISQEEQQIMYYADTSVAEQKEETNVSAVEPEGKTNENEYAKFAIAQVDDYVNVRAEANTSSEIVGHMSNGSVCEVTESVEMEDGMWFRISSGSVEGFTKAEFFLYGETAQAVIKDYVKKIAVVQCDRLNIRAEAGTDSQKIGSAQQGDILIVADDEDVAFSLPESENEVEDKEEKDKEEKDKIEKDKTDRAETDQIESSDDTEELRWIKIECKNDQTGYICLNYVTIKPEYTCAKSIEEERAEEAARKEAAKRAAEEAAKKEAAKRAAEEAAKKEAAKRAAEEAAKKEAANTVTTENTSIVETAQTEDPAENITAGDESQEQDSASETVNSTNAELRESIVEYAKQFVGTKYVSGGRSLEGGTDCSGFTCYVLANFGYSIGRTPASQYSSTGRSVSLSEAQPGDIICFGSSSCTHVAFYIGNNQIVHEANSKDGCIISDLAFMNILGVRNVID